MSAEEFLKAVLALDIGKKRIGLALRRRGSEIIFPWGVADADGSEFEKIALVCMEEDVDTVVVGLPKLLSGVSGLQARFVKDWAEKLKTRVNAQIKFVDERMTNAKRSVGAGAVSKDEFAAMQILKIYAGEI